MMLFYSQIKREFNPSLWRRGQTHFREQRVGDVRMSANTVSGKIKDANGKECDASITPARGTIEHCRCSCVGGKVEDPRCEHVAALSIWIVERGSLLRSGIGDTSQGMAETDEEPAEGEAPTPSTSAEPVTYVRGLFTGKAFNGVTLEPALRYVNPETRETQVTTLIYLSRTYEPGVWQTSHGLLLKVGPIVHEIPILKTVEAAKITHQGTQALDLLANILESGKPPRMIFDPALDIQWDGDLLKLISLNVGQKIGKHRILSYEFKNSSIRLTSKELAELATIGRLSNRHVWKGNKIYRFENPLALLSRYANRSGTAEGDEDDASELMKGFDSLYDDGEHPLHPLSVYRLILELGVSDFTVDPQWIEFHEWRKNFEKKSTPTLPKVDYGFSLRDYQKNGLSWLWSLHHRGLAALLADDMGLGKTHQALAFLSSLYGVRRNRPEVPSLVIAPTSVVAAWTQKLKKYDTGLRWHIFHGKGRVLPHQKVDVVLTTYGILQREVALREKEWLVIILDEAQAIKNASTISSRASRVLKSKFRIAMTGTPLENQATDLWSLMEFLIPGYLGTLARFKRLYGSGHDGTSAYQAQILRRLLSPFLLRRTKNQVLKELPEKTEETVLCEMTPAQEKVYNAYLASAEADEARENLKKGEKIDYAGILALLTRLKQICDHPKLPTLSQKKAKKALNPIDSGKWESFCELLNEALGSSLKVVIFTQYLGVMDMIGAWLKSNQIGHTDLRGDTPDRAARLEKFASDPECKVFICSLLAGGLGIDLTSASVCIHMDRWWNPARENQATDRLHRIGQTRGVQVFKLQIPNTVEDRIAKIIDSKRSLSGALIEESPLGLKAFSRDELLQLLSPIRSTSQTSDEK